MFYCIWTNVKLSLLYFRKAQIKLKCLSLPNLIVVNKTKAYKSGATSKCSTPGEAPYLQILGYAGKAC